MTAPLDLAAIRERAFGTDTFALLDAIDRVLARCDVQDSLCAGVHLLTTFEVRRALGVEADPNG